MKLFLSFLFVLFSLLLLLDFIQGHGHLRQPAPRDLTNGPSDFIDTGTGEKPTSNFICRNQPARTPQLEVAAGGKITLNWLFTAAHVGDCAVYLTYDTDKPESEQMWFKIKDYPRCKDVAQEDIELTLPEWLPKCDHCVLRWEWIALHVRPRIELYNQCIDVKITGETQGFLGKPIFKIPGHLPEDGTQYRNAFGGAFFLVGPEEATPGQPYPSDSASSQRKPCTSNDECDNNKCLVTGFCAEEGEEDNGLSPGDIAAIVFALLFVVVLAILVLGVLFRERFSVPSKVPAL